MIRVILLGSKLRSVVSGLVISADVMVGFPTETEAQFLDTVAMVQDIGVAFPHTFSYSERDGTPAANIPSDRQVSVADRKDRNFRLRESAKSLQAETRQERINKTIWVLPESESKRDGYVMCRSEDYLPCLVPENQVQMGRWLQVKVASVEGEFLLVG